jgi:hypothetical protein
MSDPHLLLHRVNLMEGPGRPSRIVDALISGQRLQALAEPGALALPVPLQGRCQSIDAQTCWLAPPLVDPHSVLDDPYLGRAETLTRLQAATGKARMEEVAMLFLRSNRSLPTELIAHANFERFAEVEQSEKESGFVQELEDWLFPPHHTHLDSPRAALRVVCEPQRTGEDLNQWRLAVHFFLFRSRSGEKERFLSDLCDLRTRAAHEAELFPAEDWAVIDWLHGNWPEKVKEGETLVLDGPDLLTWLAKFAHGQRLELHGTATNVTFMGRIAQLEPRLETIEGEMSFTHVLKLSEGRSRQLPECRFFVGEPPMVLVDGEFYVLREAPPTALRFPTANSSLFNAMIAPISRFAIRGVIWVR